jgi:SIR2-like domain
MNKADFAPTDLSKKFVKRHYRDFATAMASNSIFHAVPSRHFADAGKRVLRAPLTSLSQPRVIVIVGAGASIAAAGLPGGLAAAKFLRSGCQGVSANLINTEIENLSLQHNIDEDDFETTLLALSKFDRPYVLGKLRDIFARRYHPWLGYELLAHCLKHRFVDAIVNFNFDEILDQSIEDELGTGAFRKVVLDGDCPANPSDWFDDRERLKLPLYIKPHGSASQPSSMRFTRDSYTALPSGFRKLFEELFSSKHRLHMLVFGHAMQSIEFNHILSAAAKNREDDRRITFFFLKQKNRQLESFERRFTGAGCEFKFPPQSLQLDAGMLLIWELAKANLTEEAPPRGTKRHELVSEIFFESRYIEDWKASGTTTDHEKRGTRLARYFRDRTFVEIALAVAKAKGFVTLNSLASNRAGKYFSLHRANASDGHAFKSLKDACNQLGLDTSAYGGRVASLSKSGLGSPRNVIVDRATFRRTVKMFAQDTLHCIDRDSKTKIAENLRKTLIEMYEGDEVEVSFSDASDPTLLFEKAEKLPTLTALKLRTHELMTHKMHDWNAIACTAKSGEWLLRYDYVCAIKERKARLALVLADMSYEDELRAAYGNLLLPIRSRPWWSHNQHVTVFLKGHAPRFAISFERRMRITNIGPLYLSAPDDVEALLNVFMVYWKKAQEDQASFDEEINEFQLNSERSEFLDQLGAGVSSRRESRAIGRTKKTSNR